MECSYSRVYGINNAGQVVGGSRTTDDLAFHPAFWSAGVVTDMGTLGGGSGGVAVGINNIGQVVGQSQTAAGATYHATLWSGGVATDLNDFLSIADRNAGWVLSDDTLFGSVEIGINDNGWIVAGANNTVTGAHRAYLLTPVAAVPEPAGWALMLGGLAVVASMRRRQHHRAG